MIDRLATISPVTSRSGRVIAAPSWVIRDSLAANCRFLEGKVDEVGLLFFETKACLEYLDTDLPGNLAKLELDWHVHLPLDLDWNDPHTATGICLALMEKIAYLGVRRAVLHPPRQGVDFSGNASGAMRALEIFAAGWEQAGFAIRDCMLENVSGADLTDIWHVVREAGYSVCLDTGHMLSYRQYGLLELPDLQGRVRMVHLNAPGPDGRHLPLTALTPEEQALVARMLQTADDDAVLMMEIFDWTGIADSMPLLDAMLGSTREIA
ncbi:sugar phosphate isomerase/epimerase [Desulfovibrio mangrovi]|uniref:cobamide remodeling phosphodiesterase CbiR n=1 Tax=Desulfovibrio mangrovi TaxID=2976983 RepID=UPI0022483D07|nr:cobamide remodeling phosphodiesterase CbiR [Desulfovibrio mangrovi]UZP66948.1 sugar phosphate isomerase/epimerase [Desulfovibrio mangrovi]